MNETRADLRPDGHRHAGCAGGSGDEMELPSPSPPGLVGEGIASGWIPSYLTGSGGKARLPARMLCLAGRRINDAMGQAIAQKLVKLLISSGVSPCRAKVGVLGLTFKQDVPDIRNSKVPDILAELGEYGN